MSDPVDWSHAQALIAAARVLEPYGEPDVTELIRERCLNVLGQRPRLEDAVTNPHPGVNGKRDGYERVSKESVQDAVVSYLKLNGPSILRDIIDGCPNVHGPSISGTLINLHAKSDIKILGSTLLPGSKRLVNVYGLKHQEWSDS